MLLSYILKRLRVMRDNFVTVTRVSLHPMYTHVGIQNEHNNMNTPLNQFQHQLFSLVYTGEIIGGHEAVPHSRPYMVLLVQHMEDNKTKHCGGFLLNEDFVMTAAHCQAKILVPMMRFLNPPTT
uniref:Peptidase S1 domain-containing protein n=1 Tax=Seriola lalandi dorsalis TaxID=1841481 RepID=A0A3B4WN50_SERLL